MRFLHSSWAVIGWDLRMMPWAIASIASNRERRVAAKIKSRFAGECYLPKFRDRYGHAKLVLPSYLFVDLTNVVWQRLCQIDGLQRFLMCGEEPALGFDDFVDRLRKDECSGFVVFDQPPSRERFTKGQSLFVVRGQFQGLIAKYVGLRGTREAAEVDLLGRACVVKFNDGELATLQTA